MGVGGVLFSLVVFQFSCASDSFAKSDRTATDCEECEFSLFKWGHFSWSPHFGFYSFVIARPQIREKQKHKVDGWMFELFIDAQPQ